MSNVAQPCLGRYGSIGPGRMGQWLYQTGQWGNPSFINIARFAGHGACPIPTHTAYAYNGFVSDVDFYGSKKMTMEYRKSAGNLLDPPNSNLVTNIRWENQSLPLHIYNFNDTSPDVSSTRVAINTANIWGASGAALGFGWFAARGYWLFDITVSFNGAQLNPFDSTPRTASLVCKAHRHYSLGLNRDQTLATWVIGLGGSTTISLKKWLHVVPFWDIWINVGVEYSTAQPEGTELITVLVNAERISPPDAGSGAIAPIPDFLATSDGDYRHTSDGEKRILS